MRLWIPDCLQSCEAAAAWVRGAALMNGIDLGFRDLGIWGFGDLDILGFLDFGIFGQNSKNSEKHS